MGRRGIGEEKGIGVMNIRQSLRNLRAQLRDTWWFFKHVAGRARPNAEYWKNFIGSRKIIEGRVLMAIEDGLSHRPAGPRDPATDDPRFSPLATATIVAVGYEEYQTAIEMFYQCYKRVREYEDAHGCQVHKGEMAFNVAVAMLRSHDFSAAMHYFELSQHETTACQGHANWDVFESDLFDRNYWQVIDLFEQQESLTFYQVFWNTPFGKAVAKDDWHGLTDNSKLLYIMIGAERIRYVRLKSQPDWNGHDSVGLSYWNLIADLARLLETEIRLRGIVGGGLNGMVLHGIQNSPVANFHAEVSNFNNAHPINSPATFNAHFPHLRTVIENPAETRERRLACAAYLAGSVRNQVQHQVDTTMVVYTDRSAAVLTVNALLSLCRLRDWVA